MRLQLTLSGSLPLYRNAYTPSYALADNHPDREVWLQSFWEEKDSIILMDTYETITLAQYRAYQEQGSPRAIPTMGVLTKKPNNMMNPHHC